MEIDTLLRVLKYGAVVVASFSGLVGTITKTHDEKRNLTKWGYVSVAITISSLMVALAIQYAEGVRQERQSNQAFENAKMLEKKNSQILSELQVQKNVNAQSEQEFREKFQTVLVQLDAAKHEDSKRITEEKIRVIQKDFSDWATNFIKDYPSIKRDIDQARQDFDQGKLPSQINENKKEIQISEGSFSVISFAVRNVQELVRNYSEHSSGKVDVLPWDLPKNFYEKPIDYEIHLTTNSVWSFHMEAFRPAGNYNHQHWYPFLRIVFNDFRGKESGRLTLETNPNSKKYWMNYESYISKPDPASIAGERSLDDFETSVRDVIQRIVEIQLVQATE